MAPSKRLQVSVLAGWTALLQGLDGTRAHRVVLPIYGEKKYRRKVFEHPSTVGGLAFNQSHAACRFTLRWRNSLGTR